MKSKRLWFAFKLVSLLRQKQHIQDWWAANGVVICFQISIFVTAKTTTRQANPNPSQLWFAFKLVSLLRQKQPSWRPSKVPTVVICFQISIFVTAKTTGCLFCNLLILLWFAFKLVSLLRQKQQNISFRLIIKVLP